jgi:hypothetical protein
MQQKSCLMQKEANCSGINSALFIFLQLLPKNKIGSMLLLSSNTAAHGAEESLEFLFTSAVTSVADALTRAYSPSWREKQTKCDFMMQL